MDQESGSVFDPLAMFPVTAAGCYFADIDFGIEIGGEGLAVIAGNLQSIMSRTLTSSSS